MASQNSASRMYSDIDPYCEWIEGEDANTLKVDVSGFKKQQLKAQLVYTSKYLKISGERNFDRNQWFRFQKTFKLPQTCDVSKIRAKLDINGTFLYVMVPKSSALDIKLGSSFKQGVVRKLLKRKLVILNVVIAATLLVLVLFRRYKLVDGDSFGGHKIG